MAEPEDTPRPKGFLVELGRRHPGVWKQIDRMRADRGGQWPEWCFLPIGAFASLIDGDGIFGPWQAREAAILAAVGTWRVTQGIYRFDPEVMEAVWDTPIEGNLPVEPLYRLPEWCPYVETPGRSFAGRTLHGFFVHLEWDENTHRHEFRYLLDLEAELFPYPLHLAPGKTLTQLVSAAVEEAGQQASALGFGSQLSGTLGSVEELGEELAGELSPLLAVALYLCSVSADYRDRAGSGEEPGNPAPKKTRKGARLFPPQQPTVWETGYRMGADLRAARENSRSGAGGGAGPGASPRPHVRRAHWHSFWRGPKDDPDSRELAIKWLPPIAVNARGAEDLDPTIRGVD